MSVESSLTRRRRREVAAERAMDGSKPGEMRIASATSDADDSSRLFERQYDITAGLEKPERTATRGSQRMG